MPVLLALLFCALSAAQPRPEYFKPADMMTIGVYYYPEAWPEAQWPRDMQNIGKLGMEFVHMGEFAWAFMEPQEGKYDFAWLERNVQLAAKNNLKVILCTPSAAPPIWASRKYPDILMVDSRGRRMNHGSREHACWSVPKYREMVARVNTELAKRFGNNPAVWGWQLDNELSHYGKKYCYCRFCTAKFRAWLEGKYFTIAELNRDWGNAFWSQMYQSFDQIEIPNPDELVAQENPHALLDFQRWFASEAAGYLREQAETLRRYTKNQWITTNFMAMHKEVNPALSAKDLEAITWTDYPVHGDLNEGPLGFRMGDAYPMSFMHDFARPMTGIEGLMELQPGQVNWGTTNPWPYPGAIRMWIHRAFAAGARLVCTYRYRQPLSGSELYHKGLAETDGVTPSPGGREYAQAMREIAELRKEYTPQAVEPREYAARRAAFLYNVENRWDIDNHPQTDRWNTEQHMMRYYKALKRLGCPVDVITEDAGLDRYPFLVAPAYQLVDDALMARFRRYAEAGGNLVLSCRTGQKDRRGHLWEALWAAPLYNLIGARIPIYDVLPSPQKGRVEAAGRSYEWGSWGDVLELDTETTKLATYSDQFYAGKAAASIRKMGRGSVAYVAVDTIDGDFEFDMLRKVFDRAGIATQNFPSQFVVDWRDGFWVATNFSAHTQAAPAKDGARFLIGERSVPPAGVAVWTE